MKSKRIEKFKYKRKFFKNQKLLFVGVGLTSMLIALFIVLVIQLVGNNSSKFSKLLFEGSSYKSPTKAVFRTNKAGNFIDHGERSDGTSIEAKYAKEMELNGAAAQDLKLFSDKKLYEMLVKRGAKIDADMAERMLNNEMTAHDWEMANIYVAELFSEEENFKIEVKQYTGFTELKNVFDKRSKNTGLFYGTDLLSEPMAYKDANIKDVAKLLNSGASLPDNLMEHLVFADNIQLAVELKSAGYNANINYVDKLRSMNAIEMLANNYAINPYVAPLEKQISNMQKLLDLGVTLKINDGTRDALDIVLGGVTNQYPDQADALMGLAKNLHYLGIPLEQSHYQILEEIKNKYPDLYNQYSKDFQ